MGFAYQHCIDTIPPSAAAKDKISNLIASLVIPNPLVYGAQGSAGCSPGVNVYAYAQHWGFLPENTPEAQTSFVETEAAERGLGVSAGPVDPSYQVEPLHFRLEHHLVAAETHPSEKIRRLATKQAAESVSIILKTPLCQPGQVFTNPRGYGWVMLGLRQWAHLAGDSAAIAGWAICMEKLTQQVGTSELGEPYLTQHPSGKDHGEKLVCTWMTSIAAKAIALGLRDSGGYGAHPALSRLAAKALDCLVYAEQMGSQLTGLPGRLVDDYMPGTHIIPGYEEKYGTMGRWTYPAALELSRAGVPGAREFLDGPVRTAFMADNLMRPSDWKVGNGYGSMHAAGIAAHMAPYFDWRQ